MAMPGTCATKNSSMVTITIMTMAVSVILAVLAVTVVAEAGAAIDLRPPPSHLPAQQARQDQSGGYRTDADGHGVPETRIIYGRTGAVEAVGKGAERASSDSR